MSEVIDERFYRNVKQRMMELLPRPTMKRKFYYDRQDGFIPIITVEVDV